MQYENELFKVGYSPLLNEIKVKKLKWTSRLYKKICKHKIISTTIILFVLCVILNLVLIYNFFKILENC